MGHRLPRPARTLLTAALASGVLLSAEARGLHEPVPTPDKSPSPRAVRYGRDVRPILSDRCFTCHGPDENTREADLRLDTREGALDVLFEGDPDASELWQRITTHRERKLMPPAGSGKRRLSEHELETVRLWIEQGAPYEEHWAFSVPERPPVPRVADEEWVRTPVDAFVLDELEQRGIEPSPPADRRTLVRRVFLELTGLPPTPELLEQLAGDEGTGVGDWLDLIFGREPYRTRYAERMATPWMDQARYADTCGIHMDAGRQMWAWRDWVLDAYRENKPLDEFIVEQVAGDLLPDATREQKIASGFNRNHVTTDEGGAINEEYLVEYAVDRTVTTSAVFLGLTMGCARCHDHKFDPVSAEDFYSLYAFFNSNEEPGLYSQIPDPRRALEPFMELPSESELEQQTRMEEERAQLAAQLAEMTDEERAAWSAFEAGASEQAGIRWADAEVVAASSTQGTPLTVQEDGSVLAGGDTPNGDEYTLTLRTDATDLRLLLLEALPDESTGGKLGRATNGNAVIRRLSAEAVSVRQPHLRRKLDFQWVSADYAQSDRDFAATNLLDEDNERLWALGGHDRPGTRRALFLLDEPFGWEGGTEVVVRIECRSVYSAHVVVRPRVTLGSISEEGLAVLPTTSARWYSAGPFSYAEDPPVAYEKDFGPEAVTAIVPDVEQEGGWKWTYEAGLQDGVAFKDRSSGKQVSYFAKTIYAPSPRTIDVSLGSDDGFVLFLNGEKVTENRVNRGVAPDQDQGRVELRRGANHLVMKTVNTGGPGGVYFRPGRTEQELPAELTSLLLPERCRTGEAGEEAQRAWRRAFSETFAAAEARDAELVQELAELKSGFVRTMVMKELPEPRETYVLMRGAYDHPDKDRRVERAIPAALGSLPEDAPRNRLGLAQWMVSRDNPLTARVMVNRLWQQLFGTGIVKTGDDFGYQGEWPSHMELLDWLAVELQESGWDVQHVLRLVMTSATYQQSSRARPEVDEANPGNRYLASFPRRRLSAEHLRDQALYVAGLLVEDAGGPSVKPYQPEGLWREVAMIQSNTRTFERGDGEDLWRRSLYTYWKRAAPPPSMLAFDAPTREFCTTRRITTDTPLQALVLWNDEQFVEAARKLAERTVRETPDDDERLTRLFLRCTSRRPEPAELEQLKAALAAFRERYAADHEASLALLQVGDAPVDYRIAPDELAAWTLMANAALNLYETTTLR